MEKVWIRHPATGAEVRIFASALPHHLGAGWERFDPPPPPIVPVDVPDAVPEYKTPRRRRTETTPEGS